ncbi:hypothetical protein Syun_028158 [Stephania yunnanensis]|uniref:Uncharacterized protein n=1 Tax=Stephania yunnanensis TaxID=152371 RepID=A0AAP0EK88_9MAGN
MSKTHFFLGPCYILVGILIFPGPARIDAHVKAVKEEAALKLLRKRQAARLALEEGNGNKIASGCPRLEMINLGYCKKITDISLVLLSK